MTDRFQERNIHQMTSKAACQRGLNESCNSDRSRSFDEKEKRYKTILNNSASSERGFAPVQGKSGSKLSFHSPNRGYGSPFGFSNKIYGGMNYGMADPDMKVKSTTNEISDKGSNYLPDQYAHAIQRGDKMNPSTFPCLNINNDDLMDKFDSDSSSVNSEEAI